MLVEWTGAALDRLADLYVAADPADRDELERGVERINAELAADPANSASRVRRRNSGCGSPTPWSWDSRSFRLTVWWSSTTSGDFAADGGR